MTALCPIGSQAGLLEIYGPISNTSLSQISVNNSPFTASFAPRTTPPSLIGNVIDETPNNTILYKSTRYQLVSGAQICQATHRGYNLPSQSTAQHDIELVLTYNNSQVIGTYPVVILIVVPIYNSTYSNHAAYIRQLISSDYAAASLQTVFYEQNNDTTQISFAYNSCIDMTDGEKDYANSNLRTYYFPEGINLPGQDYQKLLGLITSSAQPDVPVYSLPPAIRGNLQTVISYTITDDGVKMPTGTSQTGALYTTQLSAASEDFTNKIQLFTEPPVLSTKFSSDTCPYYTTVQYKCTPFNKFRDLSGNYVIPGGPTLDTLLNRDDVEKGKYKMNGSITTTDMAAGVGIIGGTILGLAAFCWVGSKALRALTTK